MGINILGMGKYLPEQKLKNDDFKKFIDTNDEWIRTRTGITERPMAGWEPTWYMGRQAALAAIENAGIDPKDIGLVISCTATSDFHTPSMASVIQYETGAVNAGAFDLNAACTGFVYALDTARRFLETDENMKYVLVVANESLSRFLDFTDRSSCILFGDGAGAAILRAEEGKPNQFIMRSSGRRMDCLHCDNARQPARIGEEGFENLTKFNMDGREVFKFAVTEVPKLIRDLSAKFDFALEDIDWFVLHQANARIIEATSKKLKVSLDKFPMNIMRTGNTSSASIPVLLKEMKDKGQLERGMKLVFASFGGGLTWDANYIEY